ncbi:MAG TPA: PKD domain-containing protein [Spirochaetota bacterium]|nr:PKD domain-containing protein [Spirochaetota bacterium]
MKKITKIVLFLIIVSIIFTGCSPKEITGPDSDDTTEPVVNTKPVAKIKASQFVKSGATVVLDGSESYDADNDPLNYSWQILSKPTGSGAALSSDNTVNTSIAADCDGDYEIQLTVSDQKSSSTPATFTVTVLPFSGTIIFVDASNAQSGDGSELNPFKTIQSSIDFASSDDIIKVSQGIYAENIIIPGDKALRIFGGYQSGNFNNRDISAYVSRINGNGTAAVVSMEFSGGDGIRIYSKIDGFTIDGGTRGVSYTSLGNGGKIDVEISNNIIENNRGLSGNGDYGGGILTRGVSPVIIRNSVRNNQCGKGAGITVDLRDTTESVFISENIVENNIGHSDHGGGVYLSVRRGTVSHNIVRNNRIGETAGYGWGGGMIVDGGAADYTNDIYLTLSHNIYTGNSAPLIGGGLFIDEGANVRMERELIFKNSSDRGGGAGLYVDGPRGSTLAKTTLSYCTIADNVGADGSVGNAVYVEKDSVVEISKSIFWNNYSDNNADFNVADDDSTLSIGDSTYQTGKAGTGTFNETACSKNDPGFVNSATGDYYTTAVMDRGVFGN